MDDLVNVDNEVVSTESKSDDDIVGRGGFRGGVRGVLHPKIRKAYIMQRSSNSSANNIFMNG